MSLLAALGLPPLAPRAPAPAATAGAAALQALSIAPRVTRLDGPGSLQLQASGRYADGRRADLTDQVAWSSSDPAVLTVDAAGLASARAVDGKAVVRAHDRRSRLEDTLELEVRQPKEIGGLPPDLHRIDVQPDHARVHAGESLPFRAIGAYSDAASRDITQAVEWVSSAPSVLAFPLSEAAGMARAQAAGRAEVQARHRGSKVDSARVPVDVDAAPAGAAATGGAAAERVRALVDGLVALGEAAARPGARAPAIGESGVDAAFAAVARALDRARTPATQAEAHKLWAAAAPRLVAALKDAGSVAGVAPASLKPAHEALRTLDARIRGG